MDEPHGSRALDRVFGAGSAARQYQLVLDGRHRPGSSASSPQLRPSPRAHWGCPAGRPCGIRPSHGPGRALSSNQRTGQ